MGHKTPRRAHKPGLLRLLTRNEQEVPGAEDWEERRTRQRGVAVEGEQSVELPADISWLSMVCFVEDIDPCTLGLSAVLLERVRADLLVLSERDTLETYWRCLELLRRIEVSEKLEDLDVSDSK